MDSHLQTRFGGPPTSISDTPGRVSSEIFLNTQIFRPRRPAFASGRRKRLPSPRRPATRSVAFNHGHQTPSSSTWAGTLVDFGCRAAAGRLRGSVRRRGGSRSRKKSPAGPWARTSAITCVKSSAIPRSLPRRRAGSPSGTRRSRWSPGNLRPAFTERLLSALHRPRRARSPARWNTCAG